MFSATSNRHFYQFSLRTFLVLVTGCCVWVAIQVNDARRQRAAVEAIQSLGGDLIYYHQYPDVSAGVRVDRTAAVPGPTWLYKLIGEAYFQTVIAIVPYCTRGCSNDDLEHVKCFADLKMLALESDSVTDEGLAHIAGLTKLEDLKLDCSQLTEASLIHLTKLQRLKRISLGEMSISDDGLKYIGDLSRLEWLYLDDTDITDAGLVHIRRMNSLTQISLSRTKVTQAWIKKLRQALPRAKIYY